MSNDTSTASPRDIILSMSGLDYMYGILAGTTRKPAISEVLNYRLTQVAPGEVSFEGTPLAQHLNPAGAVHGGWYGTILDSCMGCAVMTGVPKGALYTTLEYKVNLTRAIPPGMAVRATGYLDHAGRSTAVAHGEIRGIEDGRLYATGTTTCIIMTPNQDEAN